jgi:hypothetical protein
MSAPSFDPSSFSGYGIFWQEAARKMASALASRSLSLKYDEGDKIFTILHSSEIDSRTLARILSNATNEEWRPHIIDGIDGLGNRLVRLIRIPNLTHGEGFICKVDEDGLE